MSAPPRRLLVSAFSTQVACLGFALVRGHWGVFGLAIYAAVQVPLRRRRGLPVGLRGRQALGLVVLIAGILAAWPWVMESVMALAAGMRSVLPIHPDALMQALPGNDPRPFAALIKAEYWLGPWCDLYLAAFTAMPLAAIAWAAATGRKAAALLVAWSHPGCLLVCLPAFVLWPISDPWHSMGWYGGLPCPWWWQGMHERLLTFTFPSLHVAVAVAVALAMCRCQRTLAWRCAWWTWVVVVAASTLALRTHWVIDLPAGALVGCLVHRSGCQWLRRRWKRKVISTDKSMA